MSGETVVDGDGLWSEYLRLLHAVGRDADADDAAGNEDVKFYATVVKPGWLQDRVDKLRREIGYTATALGSELLEQTLRERRYDEAAQLLPEALSSTLDLLTTINLGWNSLPALTPAAIAVAALYPDEKTDALFARLAALPNSPNIGGYSRLLDLRQNMKALLAVVDGETRRTQAKAAAGLDGRAFTNAVQWLVKAGVLDDDGETLRPATGAPATTPPEEQTPTLSGYRLPEAIPTLIDVNQYPRIPGPDMYDERPQTAMLSRVPEPALPLLPTPQGLRPTGQAQLLGTKHTTWLLTMKRPTAELRPVWTASVFGRDGKPRGTVTMPAPVKSCSAGADRDWVSVVDEDEHLRVYREGGELIVDVDLTAVMGDRRPQVTGHRMRADYDVTDDRLLLSVGANCWLLRPDGSGQGWSTPPKVYPSGAWRRGETPPKVSRLAKRLGLRSDLTTGEAVSHLAARGLTDRNVAVRWSENANAPTYVEPAAQLHDALGLITDDTISEVRLTRDGFTICTYYGLNADITNDGSVVRLWMTVGPLTTLSESSGSRVGVTFDSVISVAGDILTSGGGTDVAVADDAGPSPAHEIVPVDGDTLSLPGHVVRVSGRDVHVVEVSTGAARTYPLPKKPSAVVRAGDHLRIHVGAKHAEVPLP